MQANGIITLTTDFGTRDIFVGVLKGIILQIHPRASIVDITHDIPPYDIAAASFLIHAASQQFPPGSVHVVVVDPGVGSARQAMALATRKHYYIAPDNGVLSDVMAESSVDAVVIDSAKFGRQPISATFHGRDLFAPVAARLAQGFSLHDLGAPLSSPICLPRPKPRLLSDRIVGEVAWVDRFGNAITNISQEIFHRDTDGRTFTICAGTLRIDGISAQYSQCQPGQPLAIFSSFDLLEIAVYQGSVADSYGLRSGSSVEVLLH